MIIYKDRGNQTEGRGAMTNCGGNSNDKILEYFTTLRIAACNEL